MKVMLMLSIQFVSSGIGWAQEHYWRALRKKAQKSLGEIELFTYRPLE